MNNDPFSPVTVYRWKSISNKETYIFTENGIENQDKNIIKENIYKDDTVEIALNKIASFISKKDNQKYYAWTKTSSPLFTIEKKHWKGYRINPFESIDRESAELNEPIMYNYNISDLFNLSSINIVLASDLPKSLQNNKYYFSDIKSQSYKYYKNQNDSLTELKNTEVLTKQLTEYYNQVTFQGKLNNVILSDIFDNIHTSPTIDMIQWVDDTSRIVYKLSKVNHVTKELFNNWTNVDKIDKTNVINIYSVFNKKSYCKLTINYTGHLIFNYFLENRGFITWKDIQDNQKQLKNILQNVAKTKINAKLVSLNMRLKIEVHNSIFKQLVKKMTDNVFNLIKYDKVKQNVICVYKRSSNFNQNTDIYDHIRKRIELGITKDDIIEELSNLGITNNIDEMIQVVLDNNSEMVKSENIKIKDNGTIVIIQPYYTGYDVTITNCPNKTELRYLLYWLSKIISTTVDKKKKVVPPKSPSPVENAHVSISSSPSSQSDTSQISSIDYDIDSWEGGTYNTGGVPKKKTNHSKYLINMLRNADKDLFEDNYARDKCQANKQPIVLSKQMKENLEKTNQMHFDNIIEYGSRDDIKNYYVCPRLWCPESKVPLSTDVANAKCPLENEEPMQMFWDDDKNRKRYVKLIKPNDKGIYAPCCVKKKPNQDDVLSQKKEEVLENDNYIMNQSAPLPEGRYGSIPDFLHKVLFHNQDIKPEACKTTLNKSHSCFLRKGIFKNSKDSYIGSLIEILGYENKSQFVKKIRKELDLLTFLSLDNGNICKQFMNIEEQSQDYNKKLLKKFNEFKKNNSVKKLANLYHDSSNISRILQIFDSYLKYIHYISSDDFTLEKKPNYFYSLINILYNINILICEKEKEEIFFHCPSQTEIDSDFNPYIGIIVKENKYYEPLELKMRSASGEKIFKLNEFPLLKDIMNKCKEPIANTYNNIFAANNWIKSNILNNSKKFYIDIVFINDDLTIDKMMSAGKLLYKFDKIGLSYLPKLLKDFELTHKNVRFFGDYIGMQYNTVMNINDIKNIVEKCDGFDIKCITGKAINIGSTNKNEIYTTNVLTESLMDIPNTLMLYQQNQNKDMYKSLQEDEIKSKRWYELQRMVVKTLLKKYSDNDLSEINKLDRSSKIQKLLSIFTVPNKKEIQIILEELPTMSHVSLKKWLSHHTIFTKYNLFQPNIKKGKEFVFSQNALSKNGKRHIPDELLLFHTALPNIRDTEEDVVLNVDIANNTNRMSDIRDIRDRPTIFKGTMEKLPSKWSSNKKSIWYKMRYIKSNYTRDTLKTFIDWFAGVINVPNIDYNEVIRASRRKYFDIRNNKEAMTEILKDKSYFYEWQEVIKKRFKTVNLFLDNFYIDLPDEKRKEYISQILEKNSLYPNDFYLDSISKLLNISIFVIHRSKYGTSNVGDSRKGMEDLDKSSSFFSSRSNIEERPFILMYKIDDAVQNYTNYFLIVNVDKPDEFYVKYADLHENIRNLVENIRKNR